MKTKNIYYANLALNIIASILTIIMSIIALVNKDPRVASRIVFIVIASLFLIAFVFFMLKLHKSFFADPKWIRYITIGCSAIEIAYIVLLFTIDHYVAIFSVYSGMVFISLMTMLYVFLADDGKIRYNQVKKASTKSQTMTIQISTDYLVKDYYTKEEAEKTLKQLYSIHNNNGFSLDEYNRLREKIIKNTQK